MVKIDDTYFVDVDELIYTLKKKRIGKNKKGEEIETETTLGYYSSLQKALTAAMKYDTMIKAVRWRIHAQGGDKHRERGF